MAIVTVLAGCGGPTDDYTAAFDDPGVSELRVFNLGDGGAMSGILVAGRRAESADATLLVFLLD